MEDNEDINKHLKNSLNEFSVQPRMTSFDEVIKKLERKRKKRFLLLFFSGTLLLTLGAGLLYSVDKNASTIAHNTTNEKTISETSNSTSPKSNSKIEESLAIKNPENSSKPTFEKITSEKKITETKKSEQKNQRAAKQKTKSIQIPKSVTPKLPHSSSPADAADHDTKPSTSEGIVLETHNKHETIFADKLFPKKLVLPISPLNKNILLDSLLIVELDLPKEDSAKKTRKVEFLFGLSYNPQFGTHHFLQNNESAFDQEFSKAYLKNKKDQSAFKFNYSIGIKAGMLIKNKWELLAGFNYQRYRQEEKMKQLAASGSGPTVTSVGNMLNSSSNFENVDGEPAALGKIYVSTYRYLDYSLELNRLFDFRRTMKLKAGLGVHLQQLTFRKKSRMIISDAPDSYYYSSGNNSSINSFLYSFEIKGGIIEELTKKMQIQFCPNFFYSPTSVFKKDYVIKQKNYGLGLEVLFLFKIG
jgi:hypothetical protein